MADPDWRTRHCAEAVVEAIASATGRDVWKELGGCPRSWRDGAEIYRLTGCRSLRGVVTKVLGEPITAKQASRGDIAMVRGSLGIVRGEVIECMGATVPLGEASAIWRVRGG